MSSERTVHVPVLLHEVLDQLALESGLVIVDGTVGAGGHSREIVKHMPETCRLLGIDRDPTMLARAGGVLQDSRVTLRQGSYAQLDTCLDELEIPQIDRVLLDLGLSSDQLADPARGFGYESAGPLDMRFDPSSGQPGAELLQNAPQEELTAIFRDFGEEPLAEPIAAEIVRRRRQAPVQTADDLRQLVEKLAGSRGKTHPATRIFQALRIAVNRELEQLQLFLQDVLPRRLKPNGRALVISFHSLEDRLVKQAFREVQTWDNLTRKPIIATPSEVRWNPRSRSAKLRVARRQPPAE